MLSKKTYLSTFGLVTFFLLSGCSSLKNNVAVTEPQDGDRARVRVVMSNSKNLYKGVRAYPNSTCVSLNVPGNGMVTNPMGMAGGFEKSLNGKTLGMPLDNTYQKNSKFVTAEFYAAAGQPITLAYTRPPVYETIRQDIISETKVVTKPACDIKKTLTPQSGQDYQIVFDEKNQCDFSSYQYDLKTGQATLNAITLPTAITCKK